jgi:hypothetical protein
MLTGPRRLGGVLLPYMALDAWCDVRWVPEPVLDERRGGRVVVLETRYRLRGSGGWRALSAADLKQLHGLLAVGSVDVTPRTRAPGDPAAAELLVPCRLTSDLLETAPLYARDAGGEPLYALDIEFEGLGTVTEIPGALYGGLVLLGEDEEGATVSPWGTAALVETTLTVEFDGTDYDVTEVELTPEELAALVLPDDPTDADSVILDAINDLQAPPSDS